MNLRLKPNNTLSILLVDDDKDVRDSLHDVIDSLDLFTFIIHAEDGASALRKVSQQDFDLIITDLEMPNIKGLSIVEQVKENSKTRDTGIILISGNITKDTIQRLAEHKIVDIITKPFSIERIESVLFDFLKKHRADKFV